MLEKIKKNKGASLLIGVFLVVGVFLVFRVSDLTNKTTQNEAEFTPTQEAMPENIPGPDPLNTYYYIEGQKITLEDGVHEEQIPDSATKIVTKNFNEPIIGDLNDRSNESGEDASFLIVQESGGSGAFYYVVASIGSATGYSGTNGVFLGDRIAPQTQEILEDGTIVVNYADREEGASMSEPPSIGLTRYFRLDGANLVEVEAPVN